LSTVNSGLAKEWDDKNNGKLTPHDVTKGSHKKVWWVCRNNHRYSSTVNDRSSGRGCPYCSGSKVCEDNCLATVNSELSKEWHPTKNGKLTPKDITSGSAKNVWWKCKKGHEWKEMIYRRNGGYNCSYCSGHRVCKDNCLSVISPNLAKKWNYKLNGNITPNDVTSNSQKRVWWICDRGHSWQATVGTISQGCGCPYCSNPPRRVCKDNCLTTKNPELSKEWNYKKNGKLDPTGVTSSSSRKVWWKCKKGHEWMAVIASRNSGNGCPSCNRIELRDGAICDSLPEAYYYLKLKNRDVKFKHHINIGFGRCVCDFYIPNTNKYIEVTSYDKNAKGYGAKIWPTYHKNILKKKHHITKVLKAKFKFIQLKLTPQQIRYVRENSI
jgi:hypothetical protein